MMEDAVREMRRGGAAISCLFPSVQSLYRQVGFERAGICGEVRLRLRELPRQGPTAGVVALTERDRPALIDLHEAAGAELAGAISRDPFLWSRVHAWRDRTFDGFGVTDGPWPSGRLPRGRGSAIARLEGAIHISTRLDEMAREVLVSDVAFRTADAGRSLLRLLADFAPTFDAAVLRLGPSHPLLSLLDQQWYEHRIRDVWMLRILDLPQAIAQRGYPRGLETSFRIELSDGLVEEHEGQWVVEIAGGSGRARRPTRHDDQPMVRATPRGLATTWSGFQTPRQAQLLHLLSGDDEALESMGAAFAGPQPSITDRF